MRTTLNAGSLRSVENVGYAVRHSFVYFVIGLCLASCEAHDYWLMSAPIEVDSNTGVYEAHSKDEISQDLFVRYELNYEMSILRKRQKSLSRRRLMSIMSNAPRDKKFGTSMVAKRGQAF